MTNDDLRNIDRALAQLKRYPLRPVMNFMVTFAINTMKPAFEALNQAQKELREKYLDLDPQGNEQRDKTDNSLKLKEGMTQEGLDKEADELFRMTVEPALPKFRFKLSDFLDSNLSIPAEVTENLGPLVDLTGIEDYVMKVQKDVKGPPL